MNRILAIFGALVVLVGCAAQDSHREYYRAERMLEEAQRVSPGNKIIPKAEEALLKGKTFLDDAKYDKASQNFKESIRLSESIVNPAELEKKMAAKRPPLIVPAPPPAAVAAPVPTPSSRPIEKDEGPRSLPREALAKYLSNKRAGKSESSAAPVSKPSAPAVAAPAAPAAPPPAPPPAPEVAAPSAPSPKVSEAPAVPLPETKVEGPVEDGKAFAVDPDLAPKAAKEAVRTKAEVVKAPSKSIDKLLPSSARPATRDAAPPSRPKPEQEIVKVPDRPNAKTGLAPQTEKPRTKIPGSLFFGQNDASIEPETMLTLDQTSKFLLENPSTSVMFQGVAGPGESSSLIDSRFESLRSYLVGKGVPEDQVRLDTKRRGGSRAEFEMFLIEH